MMSRSRLFYWAMLITGFTTGQVAIQLINLVSGLLIVRFLGIHEYAIYVLASLLQSLAAVGSDLGVSQGVVSVGAPVRDDRQGVAGVIRAALQLRRKLFIVIVPAIAVIGY